MLGALLFRANVNWGCLRSPGFFFDATKVRGWAWCGSAAAVVFGEFIWGLKHPGVLGDMFHIWRKEKVLGDTWLNRAEDWKSSNHHRDL